MPNFTDQLQRARRRAKRYASRRSMPAFDLFGDALVDYAHNLLVLGHWSKDGYESLTTLNQCALAAHVTDRLAAARAAHYGEAMIIISDRVVEAGQRKFLIMHECGHLVLEHPLMPPHKLDEAGPSRRTPDHVRDYEAEANAFASELTMPHVIVHRWCRATPVNLDMPWRIASAFGMTILASAIRFTELSPELSTTNAIENLMGSVRDLTRRVKRWRDRQMTVRWTVTAVSDAARRFRRVTGAHDGMHKLVRALERHEERGVGSTSGSTS